MLEVDGNSIRTTPVNQEALTKSSLYINPGFRMAFDFESGLQIVPGLAFPVGLGNVSENYGVFLYLSFEHPLKKKSAGKINFL